MAFVDANRDDVVDVARLGVEPIFKVLRGAGLQVAPSSYYAVKARPASPRSQRDAVLSPVLRRLWRENYSVYGARKLWKAARRAGHDVGRDQVARLMRLEGIEGSRRTKRVRTTRADPGAPRHPDLVVGRDFTATRPNQLWVTDLTYVATWARVGYVCFIIDACPRTNRGLAIGLAHAHEHGPRRDRDGPLVTRHHADRAALSQRTPGRNSRRCATASASPRSARCPRSAPSVTPTTMPWPRP